jgi:hypothetical protein
MPSTCAHCHQPIPYFGSAHQCGLTPSSQGATEGKSVESVPSVSAPDLSFLPRGAVLPAHLATNADFCTALAAYLQKRKAHNLPWYRGDVLRVTDFAAEHGLPATLAAMKYSGMQGYKGLIADPDHARAQFGKTRKPATTEADHAAGF